MNVRLKGYLRDYAGLIPLSLGLVFLAASFAEIGLTDRPASEVVFLHYSIVAGVNLTGVWSELYFIPLATTLVWVANVVWSWRLHPNERELARILSWVSCCVGAGIWWGVHLLLVFNG